MTAFAPAAWTNATWAVVPSSGRSAGSHGWLELDTVSFAKMTTEVLGTECVEPGSFTIDESAPVPVPSPVPALEALVAANIAARAPAMQARPAAHILRSTDAAATPDGSGPLASQPRDTVSVLVNIGGSGTGTVTSSPTGVSCAGHEVSCIGWFAEGTTVTLTATASSGHAFAGWIGACSGTGACEIFIDGELTATATFTGPPTLTYYHVDILGSGRFATVAPIFAGGAMTNPQ